ncbi:MAG: CsbD family protein [Actinomycetota bacterium]
MGEKIDEVTGRAKEALGDLTDNEELQREGQLDRAGADIKRRLTDLSDKAEDGVDAVKDKAEDVLSRSEN